MAYTPSSANSSNVISSSITEIQPSPVAETSMLSVVTYTTVINGSGASVTRTSSVPVPDIDFSSAVMGVDVGPGALGIVVGDGAGGTVDAMVVFVGTGAVSYSPPPLLHPAIASTISPNIIASRSHLFEINYFSICLQFSGF